MYQVSKILFHKQIKKNFLVKLGLFKEKLVSKSLI